MLYSGTSLYVCIRPSRHPSHPALACQAFSRHVAYRVLGYFHREVHGSADVLLCGDTGQPCLVPIGHVRAVAYVQGKTADSLPLHSLEIDESLCLEDLAFRPDSANLVRQQALALL